jgi:hypothetical protein
MTNVSNRKGTDMIRSQVSYLNVGVAKSINGVMVRRASTNLYLVEGLAGSAFGIEQAVLAVERRQ